MGQRPSCSRVEGAEDVSADVGVVSGINVTDDQLFGDSDGYHRCQGAIVEGHIGDGGVIGHRCQVETTVETIEERHVSNGHRADRVE